MNKFKYFLLAGILLLVACGSSNKNNTVTQVEVDEVKAPEFNADSAYQYVKKQCDFGPRIPNSKAHENCADWLENQFKAFGATVTVQEDNLKAWDGNTLKMRNIIASYKPESGKRVLICSHWDSRPWADNDPDAANHRTPIDGADDGASGVGVMLELARQFQQKCPEVGVDLICFDLEDYGVAQWYDGQKDENSWCLGSQYWSRNPHKAAYNARFGVLLDMVGNKNAVFYQEYFSMRYAKNVVNRLWNKAEKMGMGGRFVKKDGGGVTDDHCPINEIAKIPCVDIIPLYPDNESSSFGPVWHTLNDNISNIDPSTLKQVGQLLMEVIYNEK